MGDSGQARRVGRVQQVAHDATPLHTRSPDVEARIGWLLAMSRLYGDDPRFTDGAVFVRALTEAGSRASRSLVSRGRRASTLRRTTGSPATRRCSSMQPGTLTGLVGYLRSAVPPEPMSRDLSSIPRQLRSPFGSTTCWSAPRVVAPAPWSGRSSAGTSRRSPRPPAPRRLAAAGRDGRVDVAPRSRDRPAARAQRRGRPGHLPAGSEFLLDAVASALADPRSQVVTQPVSLLARIPDRAGARPGPRHLRVAPHPAADPVVRRDGHRSRGAGSARRRTAVPARHADAAAVAGQPRAILEPAGRADRRAPRGFARGR